MANVIITSVGTSIFTKDGLNDFMNRISNLPFNAEEILDDDNIAENALYKNAYTYLTHIQENDTNKLQKYSAEIASLLLMDIDKENDKIILLSSDTKAGALSTRINCDYLMNNLGFINVEMSLIKGLNIESANNFVEEGLGNLRQKIIEIANRNIPNNDRIQINFTGGFKGTIPLLSIMAQNIYPIFYLYEPIDQNPELIKMDVGNNRIVFFYGGIRREVTLRVTEQL